MSRSRARLTYLQALVQLHHRECEPSHRAQCRAACRDRWTFFQRYSQKFPRKPTALRAGRAAVAGQEFELYFWTNPRISAAKFRTQRQTVLLSRRDLTQLR